MDARLFGGLLLLLSVLIASPAHAGDWDLEMWKKKELGSQWEGYGVGTSVHTKSTTATPAGKRVQDIRATLVKADAETYTIKTETTMGAGMPAMSSTTTERRKKDVKFEQKELRTETIQVGGMAHTCKVIQGTTTKGAKKDVITLWISKDGVVQYEMVDPKAGKIRATATKLTLTKKIGEHTVRCREFTAKMDGRTMVMHIAVGLPVQNVSMTWEATYNGMKMSGSREVVGITIKKP